MGKFIKNWKQNGRPFSGQRLKAKLLKKGLAPEYVEAEVANRVANLDAARSIGPAAIVAVVSGVPGLGGIGRLIDKTPLKKLPILKTIAIKGVEAAAGKSLAGSIVSDLLGPFNDFKNGDYKAGALSLAALVITSGAAVWIAHRFGVQLPAWLLPTILDLIGNAATESARVLIGARLVFL